jgi:hypothetical protein
MFDSGGPVAERFKDRIVGKWNFYQDMDHRCNDEMVALIYKCRTAACRPSCAQRAVSFRFEDCSLAQ